VKGLARLLAAALLGLGAVAHAAYTACPDHYPRGEAPDIENRRLALKAREICYSEFGLMHSGIARTPLWSAERVTARELRQADEIKRKNAFHADPHLPEDEQAELRDYARSGFDRGHMTPAGDMPTAQAQYESFSLANIVPQNPRNNQRLWEGIESAVRSLVRRRGELYVITGPLFLDAQVQMVGGRVLVPSHVYKLVYDPRRNQAAAYLTENVDTEEYQVVSVAELEQLAGIDFLPWMTAAARDMKLELPPPRRRGRR
jgi:endonuclease G